MVIQETKVDKVYQELMSVHREPNKTHPGGLVGACSENPVVFAKYMLGITLYNWQVDFITRIIKAVNRETAQREFVAITSRQIGKSTAVAIFSLWCAFFNKYPGTTGNNTIVGVVSASQDQSRKLLGEVKSFMRMGDKHMELSYREGEGDDSKPVFGKEFFTGRLSEKDPNNTSQITFKAHNPATHGDYVLAGSKRGSVIKSYPPTAVVLGETFTVVIIDEAGKTERISDQFFYEYIYPTGNSTDAIRIYISTPWVSSGFFYRMVNPDGEFEDSNADVLLFSIDAIRLDAPEQYKNVSKIIDAQLLDGKKDEVSRAYYCRFVKGEQSYFDPEKVREAFNSELSQVYEYGKECDMGVDFGGQVKSRTVITISMLDDDGNVQRLYHKSYGVQEDLGLLDDIKDLRERFNIQRIVVDDCPAGDVWIRQMEKEGWDIVRMNFRSEKVRKYGNFRGALNKGKILSYKDNDLMKEMLALENSTRSRQSLIQPAPGYNDDLIDSFVMSAYHYVAEESGRVKFFTLRGMYDG